MNKRLLRESFRISLSKLVDHPQYRNFPHYSFVIQNNAILGWSTNLSVEPPVYYGYHGRLKDPTSPPKLHSECSVYLKTKGIINPNKKWEVINIRVNRNGVRRLSAPCECCHTFLSDLGCHAVYYTTNTNKWGKVIL